MKNLGIASHEQFVQVGIKIYQNRPKCANMRKRKLDHSQNHLRRRNNVHYKFLQMLNDLKEKLYHTFDAKLFSSFRYFTVGTYVEARKESNVCIKHTPMT